MAWWSSWPKHISSSPPGWLLGLSENRVYSQTNSHLIGIMISKTIGFRGTLLSLLSLLSPNLLRVTMSHAGTAIAGNLGLCRLQCLWRCIKPHPVAMFFVRPSQQFENSLRIVNSCAEAPKTWTWTSWCLPAMLWDAMGWVGRVQLQVTSGPMAQMQRR